MFNMREHINKMLGKKSGLSYETVRGGRHLSEDVL